MSGPVSRPPRRPRTRTLVVVGVCIAVLAGLAVGVNTLRWKGSVTLLANWSGANEQNLRDSVIEPFEDKYRIHVVYQGSSAESQVLAADVESGTPPDVVVMPGPGELADYASQGRLKSLDGLVGTKDFGPTWMPAVRGAKSTGDHTYWVPVAADLKSMVWHRGDLPKARLAAVAAEPASWCLGMGNGATSGWPGTDWLEDILLQQAGPDAYQRFANGDFSWADDDIERAWQTWGKLVGAGTPRAAKALMTDYDKASQDVGQSTSGCGLEHQASFVRHFPSWTKAEGAYVASSEVIPGAEQQNTWEISGDLAAMLTNTPQARKLIRYMASAEVQQRWNTTKSGFSANRKVLRTAYAGDSTAETIARTLSDPTATQCWDASDAMPSQMRDAFSDSAQRYLATGELDAELHDLGQVKAGLKGQWPQFAVCGSG